MDKKQEDSRELLRDVISLLENNKLLDLRELLEEYHIMDIFDVMENLDEDMKIKLFEVLPIDMSASILEEDLAEAATLNVRWAYMVPAQEQFQAESRW